MKTRVMSACQFKDALTREIRRREWKQKVTSINKVRLEYWIQRKLDHDLNNKPCFCDFSLLNGKRGWCEMYSHVEFNDEIMELVYKLYDLTK